jgi:hypothetical protein
VLLGLAVATAVATAAGSKAAAAAAAAAATVPQHKHCHVGFTRMEAEQMPSCRKLPAALVHAAAVLSCLIARHMFCISFVIACAALRTAGWHRGVLAHRV